MTSSSNKDVSGYNVALDVSDFNYGTYQFSISTTYSKYSDFNDTTVINTDKLSIVKSLNLFLYSINKSFERFFPTPVIILENILKIIL